MSGFESNKDPTQKIESPQIYRKSTKLSLTNRLQQRYEQQSSLASNIPTRISLQGAAHSGGNQSQGLHLSEENHTANNRSISSPNLCANEYENNQDQPPKNKSLNFDAVKIFNGSNKTLDGTEKNAGTIGTAKSNSNSLQLHQSHEIVKESIEEQKDNSFNNTMKDNQIVNDFAPITQPESSFDCEAENSNLMNENSMNNKIEISDSKQISIERDSANLNTVENDLNLSERDDFDTDSISGDEDSSVLSSEDSISYLEKCAKRRSRNLKFLENQGFCATVKRKIEIVETNSLKKVKKDESLCEQDTSKKKLKGMVFATNQNTKINTSDKFIENKITSSRTSLQDIEFQFPFRSSHIRYLHSLLLSNVRQAEKTPHQTKESCYIGKPKVYVPSPIFLTGPSGSGKTSIVESIIQNIKSNAAQKYSQHCRDNVENEKEQVNMTIADAYIDCGLIESSSSKQIIKNVYKQIKSTFISSQSFQNTRRLGEQGKKKENTSTHHNISCITSGSNKNDGNPLIDDILKHDYENQVNKGYICHVDDEDSVDEDTIERQRRNQSSSSRTERKQKVNGSNGVTLETNPLSFSNSHKTEFSTLGRALTKFCGSRTEHLNTNGCAFIVLDHAEKMFSLSSKRKSSNLNQKNTDFNNLLTQFLLLPRVVGLNLTIIVISRCNLLGFSRVNNINSHLVSLGTLEDAINPIQIHFNAYRGKQVFKQILSLPKIKELIVGVQGFGWLTPYHEEKYPNDCEKSISSKILNIIYESMIDTILQSVEGTTRDIREMIRLCRQLWPQYIKPLLNIDKTANDIDYELLGNFYQKGNSLTNRDINLAAEKSKAALQEMLHNKARPYVRKLLKDCILRPGSGNSFLFKLTSELTKDARSSGTRKHIFQHTEKFPYFTKFLLLAAYLCQSNKSDYDRNLYTNFQRGQKARKRDTGERRSDPGSLTHASTASAQKELNKLRIQSFPLERMLSIFSSILNKYGKKSLILERYTKYGFVDLKQIGTITLFENLAQLRQCNLLYQVGNTYNDGKKQLQLSSLSSARFVCTMTKEHSEDISSQLEFPLSSYLFQCR